MKRRHSFIVSTAAATWLLAVPVPLRAQELGTISFPTSGAPAAQAAFIEGVKNLHSFEFDEARQAFREAQQKDPSFAMAYWGEAMSYNHPLWAEQDTTAAKGALERLAPTRDGRLAKAPMSKEKAYLEAVDVLLYGPGDKLARDIAYSDAMSRLYERYPSDHEVATLYALSLLGTVRPTDRGFRRQVLAASVAQKVFQENPKHPGAAHFMIHSFDDPDHALLALPAARVYAGIAPAAPHALHMPSHIFVQLGIWEDVAASNKTAYEAAIALIKRRHLPEGREDFHTLSWLAYAHEMLGRYDQAKDCLELARAAAERNSGNPRVRNGYLSMKARYILESQRYEKIVLGGAMSTSAADAGEHAAMPGMTHDYNANADLLLAAGISAAKLGDLATAEQARSELRALREKTEAGPTAYRAKSMAIMEREVAAHIALAKKQDDEALRVMKEAAELELSLDRPSGPPEPIKPATELFGEILLDLGRPKEAAAQFEQSLLRIPKRTPSLFGLARAAAKAGDRVTAQHSYSELVKIWAAAGPGFAPLQEAQQFLKSGNE